MSRFSPRRARTALVLCLVAGAAALRLWGIDFGLPHTLARPDEERVLGSAFNVARGEFNPGFFSYPSLYIYAVGALEWLYYLAGRVTGRFDSIQTFVASWPVDYRPLWLIGRLLTAALGSGAVWLAYRLGSAAVTRRAGLLGAFFLAVAFLHVRDSHFAVTDVPMTTLAMAGCLLLLRADRLRTRRAFALAGIVAGLAASTKYNAVLLTVPAVLAALVSAGRSQDRHPPLRGTGLFQPASTLFLSFAGGLAAAFLAGTPYALLDHRQFLADVRFEASHLREGHAVALGVGWAYHLAVSLRYGLGLPLLIAGLSGVFLATFRAPRRAAILFSFPIAYYALAGSGQTVFTRYMTPVVPFLCVGAGVACDAIAAAVARRVRGPATRRALATMVAMIAAGLVAAPSLRAVLALDSLLTKTDSRVLAARWMLAAVPAGSSIYQSGEHYGHAQLEVGGRPSRYAHWQWNGGAFTTARAGRANGLPDWIVVQRSPLVAYSQVPDAVERLISSSYREQAAFISVRERPGLVYDQQDAFYLPLHGFDAVTRPGPNLFVYRRVGGTR